MVAKYLLSIVVATKNREKYAISAIESILAIDSDNLQLVVQDNSDSLTLKMHVEENFNDPRLVYSYIPPPLSSIGNFNAALALATGDYVCLIGDDDGVNPEILAAAEVAKKYDWDALTPKPRANYLWNGAGVPSTLFTRVRERSIVVQQFSGDAEMVSPEPELKKLLRNGGVYYLRYKMPKLYHGLVKRQVLEEIQNRTGSYLGGLSPDIFSSVAISIIARSVAFVDYPLTIPGACGVSTSALSQTGKHTGELKDAPHFRDRTGYRWNNLVPPVYSPETIWVDSIISTLVAMNRRELIEDLNFPKLAAYCCIGNRGIAGAVLAGLLHSCRLRGKSRGLEIVKYMYFMALVFVETIWSRSWNRIILILRFRSLTSLEELDSMVEATNALSVYLRKTDNFFGEHMWEEKA